MKKMKKQIPTLLIINTGGTFNKKYSKIKGLNKVSKNSNAVKKILKYSYNIKYKIKEILLKDSLKFNDEDRNEIYKTIQQTKCNKIIIIHGTDTMKESCNFIANKQANNNNYKTSTKHKLILFTGSMTPFRFNKIEASFNLGVTIGFIQKQNNLTQYEKKDNIFISMGGIIVNYKKITKNKNKGIFTQ
jgi:L-asparaginase